MLLIANLKMLLPSSSEVWLGGVHIFPGAKTKIFTRKKENFFEID